MIEILVCHCGQGDTILVRLAQQTVLIDCHLPGDKEVAAFLGFLDGLDVQCLDFVFLSHPDKDHYTGLSRVIDHFSRSPRQIRTFCDSGFDLKLLPLERRRDPELIELYTLVDDLERRRKLDYRNVTASENLPGETPLPKELFVRSPSGSKPSSRAFAPRLAVRSRAQTNTRSS